MKWKYMLHNAMRKRALCVWGCLERAAGNYYEELVYDLRRNEEEKHNLEDILGAKLVTMELE